MDRNTEVPLYTEVSSFQGVGIEEFHFIQRCPGWNRSSSVDLKYQLNVLRKGEIHFIFILLQKDWSALLLATKNGHEDIIRYLVEFTSVSILHQRKKVCQGY